MPEETTAHPGSWLGDLTNEWKKAKTPEKVMIVGAIAATIGIALYLHGKSNAAPNQPGASGLAGIPANFQQGGGGGGTGGPTGGTNPPTTPTPTPKPPTVTTTPTGTPLPQKPAPAPTPFYPVRPIIQQPTTTTKTYAATNHAPTVYFQNQPVGYKYSPQSTYEVARGRATYGPVVTPPPPPKPVVVQTPAQTYLQVGTRKFF